MCSDVSFDAAHFYRAACKSNFNRHSLRVSKDKWIYHWRHAMLTVPGCLYALKAVLDRRKQIGLFDLTSTVSRPAPCFLAMWGTTAFIINEATVTLPTFNTSGLFASLKRIPVFPFQATERAHRWFTNQFPAQQQPPRPQGSSDCIALFLW